MYYEAIILNLVEKYQHLHDGETMTANRIDASVLESVLRKPNASPKSHAEFLHMDYERVLQILRYFGINSQDLRDLMNQQLTTFGGLLDNRLNQKQGVEQDKQWKRDVQKILDTLKQERFQMTRGFYLMALLKFCSDIRYRDLFPTRQVWIQNLSAVEAKNFFRDVDYEINRQEKAFDISDLNAMINDSVQETDIKDDEEETLEDKI